MDVVNERLTNTVQRVFGSGASLGGSMGSGKHPGVLTIKVDGQPVGSGRTLQEAIGVATKRATGLVRPTVVAVLLLTLAVPIATAEPARPDGMCVHRDLIDYCERRIDDAEAELAKWKAMRAYFRHASRSCCDRREG